jgi:hypothetical protein
LAFLVRARYPSSGKQHSLEVGWRRKTSTEESPKGCGDPGSGYRIEPPPDISPRRLISRLEGRMIRVAKDAIQGIMQSSRR